MVLCRCHGHRAMERRPSGMWNAGGLAVAEKGRKILKYTHKVTVLIIEGEGDGVEDEYETAIKSLDMREKDVLGRVDGLVPLSRAPCNGTKTFGNVECGRVGSCGERLVREEREKELLYVSTWK
ncbi:hypothetical protein NDU88_001766 [Pleurodeles waltl]|uniref:Uncharacterized protein n=1 Tax=Pleurodeles waltl TaxID=8319 RepID=A0AAV7T0A4_PLEWA|nr:hypothetical protein NDU88_001766 [Pleurodeles waltl]